MGGVLVVVLALGMAVVLVGADFLLRVAARRSQAAGGLRNIAIAVAVFCASWFAGGAWKSGGVVGVAVVIVLFVVVLAVTCKASGWLLRFYDRRAESGRI